MINAPMRITTIRVTVSSRTIFLFFKDTSLFRKKFSKFTGDIIDCVEHLIPQEHEYRYDKVGDDRCD